MGLLDALRGKKEQAGEKPLVKGQAAAQEKKKEEPAAEPVGKYNETCSLCGAAGTEKKWMGQYWHKKCLRSLRKGAKGMI